MFKKLLVPVDGSSYARGALQSAVGLARTCGASIVLLHVLEVNLFKLVRRDPVKSAVGFLGEVLNSMRRKGKKILGDSERFTDGVMSESVIELGDPVRVICAVAKNMGCDLIVMGSRGASELEGCLLGSVSHGVLQRSACPVLLIRELQKDGP